MTKQSLKKKNNSDILSEYNFSGGVRGKYAKRYQEVKEAKELMRDPVSHHPGIDNDGENNGRDVESV